MKIIDIKDLENYINKDLTEEEKKRLTISLIYYILNEEITKEELSKYPKYIIDDVNCIINGDMMSDSYDMLNEELSKALIEKTLDTSNFSLEEFLEKPDQLCLFKHRCPFNIRTIKGALGLITQTEAVYYDIPSYNINHAELTTAYFRKEDPEFEDLRLYHFFHPENPDWHDKVMQEKNTIIIHFIPNIYGEIIYIPPVLTEFQYNELLRLNEILTSKNIKTETNYKKKRLDEALKDEDFIKDHEPIIEENNPNETHKTIK